ncbi:MAG: RNA polymerase sigma factor [Gemmataceae bacterium]
MPEPPLSTHGTSLSLLELARGRDAGAWHKLVHLYSPLIFSWARRADLGDADASDLVQDVWQSVAAALERFRRDAGSGTFRGWLWTVARNKLNDHFRARRGKPEAAGGTEANRLLESVPEQEPADEADADGHALLHRTLELLRPEFEERTWRAFWGMTVEGRPAGEVAEGLGMAPNAVHQARFRVLRRLRQEMAGLVDV